MQARQEFLEQELCKTKERENSLACELGTVKKEVRYLMCIPVVIYLLFEAYSFFLMHLSTSIPQLYMCTSTCSLLILNHPHIHS